MIGAIEIPNPLFMVSFTAANPPVIVARSSNVVDVTRSGAGSYVVELSEKIPTGGVAAPDTQLQASSQAAGAATFVSAIEASGDVAVFARNLAGALADTTARLDVCCFQYPNLDG